MNAIRSVNDQNLLMKSTLYVNLEPCSHYGKTPPCAQLIIDKKIPRVVVGMGDPNPKVNGRGIQMLREAGVEVVENVLNQQCQILNKRFVTLYTKKRPFVILKWAQTQDGFIDAWRTTSEIPPLRISNEVTKTLNHQIRSIESAILVGTNTALLDNPHLTTRKWSTRNPVRMVVDKSLRVPSDYRIYDQTTPTVIFTDKMVENKTNITFVKLDFSKAIVPQIMDYLYQANLSSLIVEGGTQLLQAFIDANLWDEVYIETSPEIIGAGVKAPNISMKIIDTKWYDKNKMVIGIPEA